MRTHAFVLVAAALACASGAWASVNRDDAAALAQRAHGGRVLSTDLVHAGAPGSDASWRVKLLSPQGEVRVISIDAGQDASFARSGRASACNGTTPACAGQRP